jgi:hypothetical protein
MNPISRRRFLISSLTIFTSQLLVGLSWLADKNVKQASAQPQLIPRSYLPVIFQKPGNGGAILQVGPTRSFKVPSAAAAAAKDGDTIEIDAGIYNEDTATWTQNNLTLFGVNGRASLQANGQNAGGKAIWVIHGNNTLVENIEFSGATVPDRNGAGIRQEGANLVVRNCFFHDNEEGILAGDNLDSEILIEFSEFARNGYGDGQSHNMYINHVKKFTLQFCYSHHAKIGHLIKSRALENHILYNRIMDEADGTASYEIDLPNGGLSYVIGNLIQQGPQTDNSTIVAYNEESNGTNPVQELYFINNTVVNDRTSGGTFIFITGSPTASEVVNNLFVGPGTPISGSVAADHNLTSSGSDLLNRSAYDYHLVGGSSAINAGRDPGSAHTITLMPNWQYVHPTNREPRNISGTVDVGAFEHIA